MLFFFNNQGFWASLHTPRLFLPQSGKSQAIHSETGNFTRDFSLFILLFFLLLSKEFINLSLSLTRFLSCSLAPRGDFRPILIALELSLEVTGYVFISLMSISWWVNFGFTLLSLIFFFFFFQKSKPIFQQIVKVGPISADLQQSFTPKGLLVWQETERSHA